jgi:hypothetical protein
VLWKQTVTPLKSMPSQPTSTKGAPALAAPSESVEERAWKARECLAEKWCQEASEECWEIKAIEKREKQAAEEREAQEHAERHMQRPHIRLQRRCCKGASRGSSEGHGGQKGRGDEEERPHGFWQESGEGELGPHSPAMTT